MASPSEDPSLETYAPEAPVTGERKINTRLQEELPKPYMPRAMAAVDKYHPRGTEGRDSKGMSVLQQHVSFFDRNKDGIVYPWETFQGFHAIGYNLLISFAAAILINLGLSYRTQTGWIPSLLLPIYIKNIHKGKHGSDSDTYDTEGRFEPAKFEEIFSKYAVTNPDALTLHEIFGMLRSNRYHLDFFGWILAFGEWLLLYYIAKDEKGLLRREAVRGVFDGSLFEQLEKMRASPPKKKYRRTP